MARVLIVDDDSQLMEATAALLESGGHTAVRARNGAEGLRQAKAQAIDLVVTDYMMPVMDGLQLARAIASDPALSGLPVVLVSAVATARSSTAVSACLRKPFAASQLLELVTRLAVHRP